ncbi:hypothetical protein BJX66DRAFT_61390 [Aspergillus keveii]|uniref:Uncharacterized protein n=1 Tax=Aspergillus keveii TaxID=714993 RepID=A0ABR4FQ04_9EURO
MSECSFQDIKNGLGQLSGDSEAPPLPLLPSIARCSRQAATGRRGERQWQQHKIQALPSDSNCRGSDDNIRNLASF